MNKNIIYGIDAVLLVATFSIFVWAFMFMRPILDSPDNGVVVTGAVLFSFDKGDRLLIDENPEFTSPQIIPVEDKALITLQPGVYYWKVDGALSSEIRQLTVNSLIELRVRKSGESYEITNGGSSLLDVDLYDKGILTGKITLSPEESSNEMGDVFVGRQNE